jgi:hypothetical protein
MDVGPVGKKVEGATKESAHKVLYKPFCHSGNNWKFRDIKKDREETTLFFPL